VRGESCLHEALSVPPPHGEKVQENLYNAENIRTVRIVRNDYGENKEKYTSLSGTVIESTSN
jgi:hypothetical protein